MNILFVNSTHKWGGVKTWTLDVAKGLQDLGHSVWIIGRPGPFTDKAEALGISVRRDTFGMDFSPFQIIKTMLLCKKQHIDRVVVNVGKDMRTAGIAARILGIPVIHRIGLSGDMLNKWNVRFAQRYINPRLLVPCEQIRQDLPLALPYLVPDDITVIHTGKKIAEAPSQTTLGPLRCISTSQLNADKGHRDVLTALSHLKKKGITFRYHVVGTGQEESALHTLAAELGINEDIVWHGFQDDVDSLLKDADIFILPSYREGLPNSLLEAMARGLVCITRDVGGVEEIWPEWASSLMVPLNDRDHLLESSLERLLTTPHHEIDALKKRFHQHAKACFELSLQVEKLSAWL
ncbi:MAG: glycosyltransferase [Desulfoplanes sp.]